MSTQAYACEQPRAWHGNAHLCLLDNPTGNSCYCTRHSVVVAHKVTGQTCGSACHKGLLGVLLEKEPVG